MLNSYEPTFVLAPVAEESKKDFPTLVGPIKVDLPAPSLGSENGSVLPPLPPEEVSRSDINLDNLALN